MDALAGAARGSAGQTGGMNRVERNGVREWGR